MRRSSREDLGLKHNDLHLIDDRNYKVVDISRVAGFGVQITVRTNRSWQQRRSIKPQDHDWSRWQAAAKLVAYDQGITDTLTHIDVFGDEVQFSWSTHAPTTAADGKR